MSIKMKYILGGIFCLPLFTVFHVEAQGQGLFFNNQIAVRTDLLKKQGDSLRVDLRFDMAVLKLPSRQSLTLTPVLKLTSGETLSFPPVVIKGASHYKSYRRDMGLMSDKKKEAYQKSVYSVLKSGESTWNFHYNYALPYKDDMAGATLELEENLYCCDGVLQEKGVGYVATVENIPVYQITPHLSYKQPKAEAVKKRDIENECNLDFEVSKTDIREDYGNNLRELSKIQNMIDEIKNDRNLIITSISIVGFASPEGSLAVNKRLSEARAYSLVEHLIRHYDFPKNIYHVEFGGENWDGLMKYVKHSEMDYKPEVLKILQNADSYDKAKVQLPRVGGGAAYRFLLREVYPGLRKANCKIEYEVKEFSLDEAKKVIKTQPDLLSLNEMYLVANSYPIGTPEFEEVQSIILKFHPDDETVLLNAAASNLEDGKRAEAEKHLLRIKQQSPEYNNCMGVLRMLEGYYDLAEKYFKQAAAEGLKEASLNLEEIKKKRDNIKLLNN